MAGAVFRRRCAFPAPRPSRVAVAYGLHIIRRGSAHLRIHAPHGAPHSTAGQARLPIATHQPHFQRLPSIRDGPITRAPETPRRLVSCYCGTTGSGRLAKNAAVSGYAAEDDASAWGYAGSAQTLRIGYARLNPGGKTTRRDVLIPATCRMIWGRSTLRAPEIHALTLTLHVWPPDTRGPCFTLTADQVRPTLVSVGVRAVGTNTRSCGRLPGFVRVTKRCSLVTRAIWPDCGF